MKHKVKIVLGGSEITIKTKGHKDVILEKALKNMTEDLKSRYLVIDTVVSLHAAQWTQEQIASYMEMPRHYIREIIYRYVG